MNDHADSGPVVNFAGASGRCPICNAAEPLRIYAALSRCTGCTHVWADLTLD